MQTPDHDRTERILSLAANALRLPGYDQLRVGQLFDVAAHRGGSDAFSIGDDRLESALTDILAEARG